MEEPLEFRIEQIIYSKDTIFLYVEQVFPFAKQSEKWKGYSNAPDALMTYSKILLDDKILLTYDEHYLEELIEEIKLNG